MLFRQMLRAILGPTHGLVPRHRWHPKPGPNAAMHMEAAEAKRARKNAKRARDAIHTGAGQMMAVHRLDWLSDYQRGLVRSEA